MVLQRPRDLELARGCTCGASPARDLPAVCLEHNTPRGDVARRPAPAGRPVRHPGRPRDALQPALLGQRASAAPPSSSTASSTRALRYTGELPRVAVVVNEPVRRGRVTGTDLLPGFAAERPLDVFGMRSPAWRRRSACPPTGCRARRPAAARGCTSEMARRRVYLHPLAGPRSGLSLLEAMHLGHAGRRAGRHRGGRGGAAPTPAWSRTRLDVLHDAVRGPGPRPGRSRARPGCGTAGRARPLRPARASSTTGTGCSRR